MDILKGDAKILATKKEIRGVIVPRHDTAINWSKAVNFTPENGELIIISADNATDVARGYYLDSDGNKLTSVTVNSNGVNKVCVIKPSDKVRFKFGNGKDNVNALPFQTEAIQGTASGSVIQIDDISPVTHDMSVKVRSKNILPYPYAETTKTLNGITITDNGDGSINLNGTSTAQVNFYFSQNLQLKKGITYTLSGSGNYSFGGTAAFYIYNSTYGSLAYINLNADNSFTFTPTKDINGISCYIVIPSDRTVSGTLKPQLELGTTATAYTPYVDLTAVKVTRCGKNLFDTINAIKLNGGSNFSITNNAITVSQNGNYNYASANVLIPKSLMGKTVTISAKSNTSGANVAALRMQWVTADGAATGNMIFREADSAGNIVVTGTVPIQPDEAHSNLCLMFYSNSTGTLQTTATYTATYSDIQIELGTTATNYEPYKECAEYTPTADGTVNGVTSLYPNTTLMTDTDGVIIDCEYLTNNYKPVLDNRIPKHVQADWNQNDETANDYIKNRPGGYIDNDTIVKIPEKYLDIKNTNIVNGSKTGSLRTVGSDEESFTEGSKYTLGDYAFAEGYGTRAYGEASHSEGYYTIASDDRSHVQGQFNITDEANTYADIIGNGQWNKRSNAATVDWKGNAWYAGNVYVGSTSGTNKDSGSKKLATEEYTNNIINKKIVDYIVEQGISGIWTYRKWKSGIAECWGKGNVSVICNTLARSVFFSDNKGIALPSGLFTQVIMGNAECGDPWSWTANISVDTSYIYFRIVRGTQYSAEYSPDLHLSVKGKWK